MHILRHHKPVPRPLQGAVYALGNFDGVHKGHQIVIGEAARVAKELGVPLGVLVFEPHPKQFFFPDQPFFRLTPFRAKARLLKSMGVDILAALPFDAAMAKRLAPEFIMDVLVDGLHASHIVAGYDYRFGKGRAGDASVLSYMGAEEGFGVSIVEEVSHEGEAYSSTRIRECLSKGDPRGAAALLGHAWTVETHVMPGDKRGRTIGFPTANLALEDHVQPALGVYAVRVEIEDGPHQGFYDGVANFGRRPTFDKKDVILEVHLFDFDGDIYGHHIAVSFVEYLRAEKKFDGLDALKAQIATDSAKAREILAAEAGK
jgi:riboflavin kinase/FMN adenylyltransferase|tara:strand:- start:16466 stop:17413 length:948 start_codon:yes stop_codon:yes gene_type:complete